MLERLRARRPRSSGASSGPAASSASGATPTCCAGCGGARSRRCAREVEPVEGCRARPLPPGVARRADRPDRAAARRRWSRCIAQLQGVAARPRSVLEHDVLRRPGRGYRPADLDELCAAGRGGVARRRAARCRGRTAGAVLPRPGPPARPGRPASHRRRRSTTPLRAAPRRSGRVVLARPARPPARTASDEPARARRAVGPGVGRARSPTTPSPRCARAARPGSARRARPVAAPARARCAALGPPAAAGPLVARDRRSLPGGRRAGHRRRPTPAPTSCSSATASSRREAVAAEGLGGGFAAVYPVLKAMEETGPGAPRLLRRGARRRPSSPSPGAVDRLRVLREPARDDEHDDRGLAATDPAQPYGAALPWPESAGRPARARRARTSCSATAIRSPTSSGAAAASRRSPDRPSTCRVGRRARRAGSQRPATQDRDGQGGRSPRPRGCLDRRAARRRVRRGLPGTHLPFVTRRRPRVPRVFRMRQPAPHVVRRPRGTPR